MNYTNYIGTLRNNLCHVLTMLRDNEKKIKKIRESIENLEMEKLADFRISIIIEKELNIEFCETLNSVCSKEANRLVEIILDKPIGV